MNTGSPTQQEVQRLKGEIENFRTKLGETENQLSAAAAAVFELSHIEVEVLRAVELRTVSESALEVSKTELETIKRNLSTAQFQVESLQAEVALTKTALEEATVKLAAVDHKVPDHLVKEKMEKDGTEAVVAAAAVAEELSEPPSIVVPSIRDLKVLSIVSENAGDGPHEGTKDLVRGLIRSASA